MFIRLGLKHGKDNAGTQKLFFSCCRLRDDSLSLASIRFVSKRSSLKPRLEEVRAAFIVVLILVLMCFTRFLCCFLLPSVGRRSVICGSYPHASSQAKSTKPTSILTHARTLGLRRGSVCCGFEMLKILILNKCFVRFIQVKFI